MYPMLGTAVLWDCIFWGREELLYLWILTLLQFIFTFLRLILDFWSVWGVSLPVDLEVELFFVLFRSVRQISVAPNCWWDLVLATILAKPFFHLCQIWKFMSFWKNSNNYILNKFYNFWAKKNKVKWSQNLTLNRKKLIVSCKNCTDASRKVSLDEKKFKLSYGG